MDGLIIIATLIDMITAVIATEAITQLLTKSEFSTRFIKKPLFNMRGNKFFGFIHDVLDCGYCTSVWAAILPAIWFFTDPGGPKFLDVIIYILVLHRLSNMLHFLIDWLDEKRPRVFNLEEIEKEK